MMTIKQLERWAAAGLVLAALMAVPSFARAQNTADNDTTRQELRTFDQFLDNHPQIANDLKKHPALVNDAGFVRQHRELGDFLRDHPRVREELKENPGAFMNRERGLEGKEEKTEGKKHRKHQRNDRDRDRN